MGALPHNLLVFVRTLRGAGIATDPERARLCLQALEHTDLHPRAAFYHAARATLVYRKQDLASFDRLFATFWQRPTLDGPPTPPAPRQQAVRLAEQAAEQEGRSSYSARELLRRKDFRELSDTELIQVRGMITGLSWQLGQRRSRRRRPGAGRRLDHRRSWRTNLQFGGEPLRRVYRRRVYKPRPLVLIADVSGSMERYAELMLHLAHGLVRNLNQPIEVFVFSTRLSRITRQLRSGSVERVLREVSEAVPDWSGGTRIGEALKRFNYRWARRTLSRGALAAVISDGLDRGQVGLLATEMARLQRSCYRLIWLNPLLGSPTYQPRARGMQAALPYVDHFLPIHNLLSMEQFAGRLPQLSHRPARRPTPK